MVNENTNDLPKKYDINKLVTRQTDIEKILKGQKTTVRRSNRYADPDDEIVFDGQIFIVKEVYSQRLKTLTEEDAIQEGYHSLEDYKDTLTSIHHSIVWDPEEVVWTHILVKKK